MEVAGAVDEVERAEEVGKERDGSHRHHDSDEEKRGESRTEKTIIDTIEERQARDAPRAYSTAKPGSVQRTYAHFLIGSPSIHSTSESVNVSEKRSCVQHFVEATRG